MIYLQNITTTQSAYVPKHGPMPSGDVKLTGRSTVDLTEEFDLSVSPVVLDKYFKVYVALPSGIPDGEYEYALKAGGVAFSTGLLVIGGEPRPSEYNKSIEYEQYESE